MAFRTSNACKSSCLRIDVLCWFPEEMHVVWKLKLHLQSTKTSNWPANFLFSSYNLKYFSSIPKKCFISLWQWLTFHLQIDKIFHWEERCSVTNLFRLPTLMTSLQSQYLAVGYNVQWILKHIYLWRCKDVHQHIFRMKIIDWGLTTTAILMNIPKFTFMAVFFYHILVISKILAWYIAIWRLLLLLWDFGRLTSKNGVLVWCLYSTTFIISEDELLSVKKYWNNF